MEKFCIQKVQVYDGTGNFPFVADILVEKGRIAAVGRLQGMEDCSVIPGEGLALAPGFINTHSHLDLEVFKEPASSSAIYQGITTEILGQDGSSVAPVTDEILVELEKNMAPLAGVLDKSYWWRSYGDYLREVNKANPAVRVEGLVGHGTVRMCVMGNENRKPSKKEMEEIKELLARCLEEGARGLSLGLIYPPGSYADTDELVEVARVVARYDGIIMVHMRNEQDKILQSLEEMEHVLRESRVRLHISHLKALGYRNWGKISPALQRITELRAEGLDLTFDQYPYTAACTGLKVTVPMWAYEGGEQGFQGRLRDSREYQRILQEVDKNIEARGGAAKILIASVATGENHWMAGKNLEDISRQLGMDPGVAALHILQVEGPSVVAIYFSISEDDVVQIMKSQLQGICSDGIMGAHPHPRTYGSFPRVLGYYCRELGVMSLQEAIRKMTMEPARRLRLWDRGLIREGMSADLVLFDPLTVRDDNTYMDPIKHPIGIKGVWVRGERKFWHATDKQLS